MTIMMRTHCILERITTSLHPRWKNVPPSEFLARHRPGRLIRANTFSGCGMTSSFHDHIRNNPRTFHVPRCNTDQLEFSSLVLTASEWNHQDAASVYAPSVDRFNDLISDITAQQEALALTPTVERMPTVDKATYHTKTECNSTEQRRGEITTSNDPTLNQSV